MKYILVFLFFQGLNGIAQNIVDKIVSHGNHNFSIIDSSLTQLEYKEIKGFNFEFYSAHIRYIRTNNGNLIELNAYRDSVIYFQELDSNENFITGGEMRIDTMQTYLLPNVFMNYDDDGNQVYLPDTLDTWKQDGIWKTPITSNTVVHTTYNMGVEENEQLIIVALCDELMRVELDKGQYNIDNLTKELQMILPEQKMLEKLINGHWFHPACRDWIYDSNPIWVFLRNKPDSFGAYGDGRIESNFLSGYEYEGKNRFSCGTGRTKEDFHPKSAWKITKDKRLIIGDETYEILYIDKEIMLVK